MDTVVYRSESPTGLAALECTASCIVAALSLSGSDPRYFLLGYWHIGYYDRMLMSVRNMKWIDLHFEYGIRFYLTSGSAEEVSSLLDEGGMAIVLCRASKLRFFPRTMLGFESSGFYHSILLHGRGDEEGENRYKIVDPVAGYAGEMTAAELSEASVRRNQLVYCKLTWDADYSRPSRRESLRKESAAILKGYRRDAGKAFELFCADVTASDGWEEERRRTWAEQNMITLSAMIRMRGLVWKSYLELGSYTAAEAAEGSRRAEAVKRSWMNVNLLLAKLGKRRPEGDSREGLLRKLEGVQLAELELLEYLEARGGADL
ncbi:hypothetical protein [Paenibacillus sinopodophylli]|uniref:hypothetical protein n=1 Tax=Paenibacillus sinopodophylli TaxID=1837342 RepID=UPI00110CDD5C|nr:hypothetical protein [Paenibacillus sinopodophylli]